MPAKVVRAPNVLILIAAGIALLFLATAAMEGVNWNDYRIPVVVLALPALKYAILGTALLYVAFRQSQFAGATAVVVATFLTFGVVFDNVTSLAFGLSARVTWWTAINLAIATAILWPSVFPWSRSANKPVLFWMGLTFGTLTLLTGTAVLLARV